MIQRSIDVAQVRVVAIRDEAGQDDAEALARLFEDPAFPDDGCAEARLRTILDATERRLIRGLHTGLPFSDRGFRGDRQRGGTGLRDPWPPSRNQVGHFLTAVGLAFRPEKVTEPVLGWPMRTWLGADPALSDDRVGKRLTIGHEFAADPGVIRGALLVGLAAAVIPRVLGLRGRAFLQATPVAIAAGGLAGALAEQFLGFRRQFHCATAVDEGDFDRALSAAGPGPTLNLDAVEAALEPLFERIDVHSRGNSYQDLRLSLLGWWLGDAVRRGSFDHADEVAAWIRAHLASSRPLPTA